MGTRAVRRFVKCLEERVGLLEQQNSALMKALFTVCDACECVVREGRLRESLVGWINVSVCVCE